MKRLISIILIIIISLSLVACEKNSTGNVKKSSKEKTKPTTYNRTHATNDFTPESYSENVESQDSTVKELLSAHVWVRADSPDIIYEEYYKNGLHQESSCSSEEYDKDNTSGSYIDLDREFTWKLDDENTLKYWEYEEEFKKDHLSDKEILSLCKKGGPLGRNISTFDNKAFGLKYGEYHVSKNFFVIALNADQCDVYCTPKLFDEIYGLEIKKGTFDDF